MKGKNRMKGFMALVVSLLVMVLPLISMAEPQPITLTGEVNDNYQIVDSDGQVYEVADTEQGNGLVENHISKKVEVTGTVEEEGDTKILTVISYKVLAD